MKEKIKELRVRIDGLSQLTKELKQLHVGDKFIASADNIVYRHKDIGEYWQPKEIEKAYDSLILAKAWLGKVLEELGKAVNQGEDLVEEDTISYKLTEHVAINWFNNGVNTWKKREFEPKTHKEKVEWLIQTIESAITNDVKQMARTSSTSFTKEFNIARTNSYNHLCEARFWLGFELQKIKENG